MRKLSYYKLFFKAISNKTRFEIIALLRGGPKSVTDICKRLGFEQSRVSHNLKCLIDCGFVSAKWVAGNKLYNLNGEMKPILNSVGKHIEKYKNQLVACGALKSEDI